MSDLPPRWLLAVVLAAGVVLPGVVSYLLAAANAPLLSDVAWVLGYGLAVVVVWYGWLRPLDITGPD